MAYLDPSEYIAYGLTAETVDHWVEMASALMEAHCRRPTLNVAQYVERLRLTAGSQSARLSYMPLSPLAPATSPLAEIRVRYGRPRRGEMGEMDNSMFSQVAFAFSLPGSWTTFDPAGVDLNSGTGEVTFPTNLLGLPYNEVEITYAAGCDPIPAALKFACAQIVRNAQATPALNVKSNKLDTLQMQYFSGSLLDANVQSLLAPFVAQRIG